MKALGKCNFACGIFVDLQKAVDIVDHNNKKTQIILELEEYQMMF